MQLLCISERTVLLTRRCLSDKWACTERLISIIWETHSRGVKGNPPMKLHWVHFNPGLWQYWLTLGVAVTDWINSCDDEAHSWLSTFRDTLKCQSVNGLAWTQRTEAKHLTASAGVLKRSDQVCFVCDLVHFGVYERGLNMIWMFIDPLWGCGIRNQAPEVRWRVIPTSRWVSTVSIWLYIICVPKAWNIL